MNLHEPEQIPLNAALAIPALMHCAALAHLTPATAVPARRCRSRRGGTRPARYVRVEAEKRGLLRRHASLAPARDGQR